jgi:hypothetical protein
MGTFLALVVAVGAVFLMIKKAQPETSRGVVLVALVSFLIVFVLVRYLNLMDLFIDWL